MILEPDYDVDEIKRAIVLEYVDSGYKCYVVPDGDNVKVFEAESGQRVPFDRMDWAEVGQFYAGGIYRTW